MTTTMTLTHVRPEPEAKHPVPTNKRPFIVAITNLKGGVAKTTTAVHFAEYLRKFGTTILVDSDPNRSAMSWSRRREVDGFHVVNEMELARFSGQACAYVIDTKARPDDEDCMALVRTASAIVLPTSSNGDDLRVTIQTAKMLAEVGSTKHRALITRARTQAGSTDTLEAKKYLEQQGIPVFNRAIRHYVAYPAAFLDGVPVRDVKNPKAKDAWSDYEAVMKELINV